MYQVLLNFVNILRKYGPDKPNLNTWKHAQIADRCDIKSSTKIVIKLQVFWLVTSQKYPKSKQSNFCQNDPRFLLHVSVKNNEILIHLFILHKTMHAWIPVSRMRQSLQMYEKWNAANKKILRVNLRRTT